MQISTPPTLVPLPFATSGTKNVIPESASPTPGLASLDQGFPPITMTPIAAGGIPPTGADFNGILNLITQSIRWANAGGGYKYNSAFATDTNVNGYPAGAVLLRGDGAGYWLNLADNNTTDPEGATPANWAPLESYGITAVTGLTNANVTLTPAQYGMSIITLAGALTGNVQIIFPPLKSQWKVVNATTGAFTVTCKTAAGTGVIVAQGGEANVYGDGTNIVLNALQIAPATQSQHAVQLGQVSGVVGQSRNLVMNVTAASATATITADEIIVESALGGLRYCLASFSKTINLGATGAGGMDTGTAPVTGYVAIYAIYNPNAAPSATNPALLATNATSAVAPSVYAGANMPAGYTASALVSVRSTTSGRLFAAGYQRDREITIGSPTAFQTGTATPSPTSVSIAGTVPPNAVKIGGTLNTAASNAGVAVQFVVSQDSTGFSGGQENAGSGGQLNICPFSMMLATPQTLFYTASVGSGPFTVAMQISSYWI